MDASNLATMRVTNETLPPEFENEIVENNENSVLIRSNVKSLLDINTWTQKFGMITNTKWNSRSSQPQGRKFVCKKIFICKHSSFGKSPPETLKRSLTKNKSCKATIMAKIKVNSASTRRRDTYVRRGLFGIILINLQHGHDLDTTECSKILRSWPSSGCKEKFYKYFNCGLGITESSRCHEEILKKTKHFTESDLNNSWINPSIRTIRYWRDLWKLLSPDSKLELKKANVQTNTSADTEKRKLSNTSTRNKNPKVSEEASSSKRMKLSDSATTLETTPPIPEVSPNPDSSVISESDFDSNTVIKKKIFDSDEDAEVTEHVSNEPNNSLLNSEIIVKEESFEVEEPSESLEVESFRNSVLDFGTSVTPPITVVSSVITNHKLADVTEKQDSLVETTVKVSLFSQILNPDSSATVVVKEEPDSFMESTSLENSLLVTKGRNDESVTAKEEPSSPKMSETSLFTSMLVEKTLSDFANTVASVTSSSKAIGTALPSTSIMLGNPFTESSNIRAYSLPGSLEDSLQEDEARHVEFSKSVTVKEEPSSHEPESISLEDSLLVTKGRNDEFSKSVKVKEEPPSSPEPMSETSLFTSMLVEKTLSDFANTVASATSSSNTNGTALPSSSIMLGNPLTESSNVIAASLPGYLEDSLQEDEARHVEFSKSVAVKEEPFSTEPMSETSLFSSMPVESTSSNFANTPVASITSTNANGTALPSSSILLGNPLAGSSNMIATSLPGSIKDSLLVTKGKNDEFSKPVIVKEEPSSPEPMSEASLFSSMPVENTLSNFANTPMATITSSSNMPGNSLAESSNMIGTSLSGSAPIKGSPLPGSATGFSVPYQSSVIETSSPGAVNFIGTPIQGNYIYGYSIVSNSLPPEAISQGNDTMMSYSLPGAANLITTSLSEYPNTVGNSLSNLITMVNNFSPDSSPMMRSSLPASATMKASSFPGTLPGSATLVGTSLPSSANVIGNYLPSTNNVLPQQISYPFRYPCPTIIGASLPGSSNTVQTSLPTSSNVIQTSLSGSSNVIQTSLSGSSNVIQTLSGSSNVIQTLSGSSSVIQTSLSGSSNVIQTSLSGSSNVIQTSLSGSSNVIQTSLSGSSNVIQTSLSGSSNVIQTSLSGSSNVIQTSLSGSSNVTRTSVPGSLNIIQTSLPGSSNVVRASLLGSANMTTTSLSSSSNVVQTSLPGSETTTNNSSPDSANIVRTLLNSANILRSSLSPSTEKVNTSLSSSTTVISNSAGDINTPSSNSSSSCSTTTIATSVVEPKSLLQGSGIIFKEESFEISETPVELDSFTLEKINRQRELIKADFEKQIKLKTINYFMKF